MSASTYIVRKGDTVTSIAKAHQTTIPALESLNPALKRHPNDITPGQVIKLPALAKIPVKKATPAQPATPPAALAAVTKAHNTHHWPQGMCDNFCANMYGFAHSGYGSAVAHWAAIPAKYKHAGVLAAPKGALIFYGGGSHGFGHITISDGRGSGKSRLQTSIDMHEGHYSPGNVDQVTTQQVLNWGTLRYLGWADPFIAGHLVVKL